MIDLKQERVLVTGGSGFLGRHVCARLADMGATFWAPNSDDCNLVVCADIEKVFESFRPSTVIHLAALCGGIGLNQSDPSGMVSSNLRMGLNVVDFCWFNNSKLVLLGSVCSYPKHCPVPFKGSDLWNGYPEETNAPYGIAKRTLFEMARAYHQQHGLKVACLLPANLYGPGDNFDLDSGHVIPAMVRKMIEAKESGAESVTLWGTGKPTREFLYVEDCAEAIIRAAERITDPSPINFGTGREISIYELAHVVRAIVQYDGAIVWDATKPDGQPRRCLDITRAKDVLGWESRTRLEAGLRKTVEWYKSQRMVAV